MKYNIFRSDGYYCYVVYIHMIMYILFLVFSMPRRGSILNYRSDRSTSKSDRSTSSKSFQTTSRYNNKGSTVHQPVYQNANEYYIPTLGSTHPPQHDYERVDAYQYCERFCFQDLLQTQWGFSWDNQLVYGGHNLYGSHGRVDGDCSTLAVERGVAATNWLISGYFCFFM